MDHHELSPLRPDTIKSLYQQPMKADLNISDIAGTPNKSRDSMVMFDSPFQTNNQDDSFISHITPNRPSVQADSPFAFDIHGLGDHPPSQIAASNNCVAKELFSKATRDESPMAAPIAPGEAKELFARTTTNMNMSPMPAPVAHSVAKELFSRTTTNMSYMAASIAPDQYEKIPSEDLRPMTSQVHTNLLNSIEIKPSGQEQYPNEESVIEDEDPSTLTITDKLTSTKWQFRKIAYQELAECFQTGRNVVEEETEGNVFEVYAPWLTNMICDNNLITQQEGLKTALIFFNKATDIKQNHLNLCKDLLDRVPLTKPAFYRLSGQILLRMMRLDQSHVVLGELTKRLGSRNTKEACICLTTLTEGLGEIDEAQGRILWKGLLAAQKHQSNEVRLASVELCKKLFSRITDSVDTFINKFGGMRKLQIKEMRDTMGTVDKSHASFSLFEKSPVKRRNNGDGAGHTSHGNLLEEMPSNAQPSQKEDLNTLVPANFTKMKFITDTNQRKRLLENLNTKLEHTSLLEGRDYTQIINIIVHSIEESNVLLFTESIKTVDLLIPKISKSFITKGKQLTQILIEKLKEKRRNVISLVKSCIEKIVTYQVMSEELLFDVLLDNAFVHRNPQVKEHCIHIVTDRVKSSVSVDLLSGDQTQCDFSKFLTAFGKKLGSIAKEDTSSKVRDAVVQLLQFINSNTESGLPQTYAKLIPKTRGLKEPSPQPPPHVQASTSLLDIDFLAPKVKAPSPPKVNLLDLNIRSSFTVDYSSVDTDRKPTLISLVQNIRGLTCYNDTILGNILSSLDTMKNEGVQSCQQEIFAVIEYTFNKLGKNGKAHFDLLLTLQNVIRYCIEFPTIDNLILMLAQFPAFLAKCSLKTLETTLDDLFMMSKQVELVRAASKTVGLLRDGQCKLATEERTILCIRKLGEWLSSRLARISMTLDLKAAILEEFSNLETTSLKWPETVAKEMKSFRIKMLSRVKREQYRSRESSPEVHNQSSDISNPKSSPETELVSLPNRSNPDSSPETQFISNDYLKPLSSPDAEVLTNDRLNEKLDAITAEIQQSKVARRSRVSQFTPTKDAHTPTKDASPAPVHQSRYDISDHSPASTITPTKPSPMQTSSFIGGSPMQNFPTHIPSPYNPIPSNESSPKINTTSPIDADQSADQSYISFDKSSPNSIFGTETPVSPITIASPSRPKTPDEEIKRYIEENLKNHVPYSKIRESKIPGVKRSPLKPIIQLQENFDKEEAQVNAMKANFSRPITTMEALFTKEAVETPAHNARKGIDIFSPEQSTSPAPEVQNQLLKWTSNTIEKVMNFQHLLLHSKDPIGEIMTPLLVTYGKISRKEHKLDFIKNLANSLSNEDIANALPVTSAKAVLEASIKFCVNEKMMTDASQNGNMFIDALGGDIEITVELQNLVGKILEAKEPTSTAIMLLQIVNDILPVSYREVLSEDRKVYLRLALKCLSKVVSALSVFGQRIRVFDICIELRRLFDLHPPEELTTEAPSLAEYEHMFKVLKQVCDQLISLQPEKVQSFLRFVSRDKSVFITFLAATLKKKYHISME